MTTNKDYDGSQNQTNDRIPQQDQSNAAAAVPQLGITRHLKAATDTAASINKEAAYWNQKP